MSNSTAIRPRKTDGGLDAEFLTKLKSLTSEKERVEMVDGFIGMQPDKSVKSKLLKNKFYMHKLKYLAALGYRKAAEYWPDYYAKYGVLKMK